MTLDKSVIQDSQARVIEVFKSLRGDLLNVFGKIEFHSKADTSPVTEWDVRVENILHEALKAEFPTLGFAGEETGKHGNEETYWLVDPIDGTSSFIRGLVGCTNMAALVDKGVVIAAVIYDFVNDIVYTARKGEGAFKDDQRLQVNTARTAGNLAAYSFSTDNFGQLMEIGRSLGIRMLLPFGAAGNTYALLASGVIDGLLAIGSRAGLHDNAPGMLLAEEAGAHVLSLDDKQGVYRQSFVIGTPNMITLVEKSGLL